MGVRDSKACLFPQEIVDHLGVWNRKYLSIWTYTEVVVRHAKESYLS